MAIKRNTIQKKLILNKENVEWFEKCYPYGSLTGLVNILLERFRHLHPVEQENYIDYAAKQVKDES